MAKTASARKIESNRRNALRSTGPRTQAGRRKASRNARKHGLAISVGEDPSVSAEIDELARMLVPEATGLKLALARELAEAELEVMRVRAARLNLIRFEAAKLDARLAAGEDANAPQDEKGRKAESRNKSELVGRAVLKVERQLFQLQRYERRAIGRRKRVVRALLQT